MMRTPEAIELLTHAPNAYRLAVIIALRCRWREGFNVAGLRQGEAILGDWQNYGMTRREYRTALKILCMGQFAATRRATAGRKRGTIARLIDMRLFDTSPPRENNGKGHTKGHERASEWPVKGHKRIRLEEGLEEGRKKENEGGGSSSLPAVGKKGTTAGEIPSGAVPSGAEVLAAAGVIGISKDVAEEFIRRHTGPDWKEWHDQLREYADSFLPEE